MTVLAAVLVVLLGIGALGIVGALLALSVLDADDALDDVEAPQVGEGVIDGEHERQAQVVHLEEYKAGERRAR